MSSRNPFADLSDALVGRASALGQPGQEGEATAAARTPLFIGGANSQPLGARTGVPSQTRLFTRQVRNQATMLEGPNKQNRVVKVTAPDLPFGVYVSTDSGVDTRGAALPPGQETEIIIPGFQTVWAITDAPGIWIPVKVQVAPLLAGDREREWSWEEDEIPDPFSWPVPRQ